MQTVECESLLVCHSVQAGQAAIDRLFGKGLIDSVEAFAAQNAADGIKYILHHSALDAATIASEIASILKAGHFTFQSL